ncbi:hypothetical protein GQ53DRAFT_746220 [Thozetella sp. PMI_491]|nr:hypothetical protein GQ53DRAFT_746220 [Thozetella sp. PMI_491]
MCAYSQSSRGWRSEIDEAYSDVNAVCGDNKSGWVYISAYDKSYGRDNAGLPECGF